MILTDKIKNIIFDITDDEYKTYLKDNKLLFIQEEQIETVINSLYDNNIKNIKTKIRTQLKEKYAEEYPSSSIEQLILEIFQDRKFNINKITEEIRFIQKKNYTTFLIPIINGSLNLNISIMDNYIVINAVNTKNIEDQNLKELYAKIDKYKFISGINEISLEEYPTSEKITKLKEEINGKNEVRLNLYYLKTT